MTRTVKAPDERRNELITHARRLFFSQGYDNTAVGDIVAAAGVAKGTFYYYFDSKHAMLEALVDELLAHSQTLMQGIIAQPTLSALEKWHQALQVVADWKSDHKAEFLALLKVMEQKENLLFRDKIRTRTSAVLAPELAEIIAQGVAEGVFHAQHPAESAAIVLAIFQSARDGIAALLLQPGEHERPAERARQKFTSVQTAIERVLGAPPGSLPLVDDATLQGWFDAAALAVD